MSRRPVSAVFQMSKSGRLKVFLGSLAFFQVRRSHCSYSEQQVWAHPTRSSRPPDQSIHVFIQIARDTRQWCWLACEASDASRDISHDLRSSCFGQGWPQILDLNKPGAVEGLMYSVTFQILTCLQSCRKERLHLEGGITSCWINIHQSLDVVSMPRKKVCKWWLSNRHGRSAIGAAKAEALTVSDKSISPCTLRHAYLFSSGGNACFPIAGKTPFCGIA